MSSPLCLLVAAVAGAAAGAVALLSVQGLPGPGTAPAEPVVTATEPSPALPASSGGKTPIPAPAPEMDAGQRLLLVWTPTALPRGLADRVRRLPRVRRVTAVRAGTLEMVPGSGADGRGAASPGPGFVVALDAMAFDPSSYPEFLPPSVATTFAELRPDQALLGETAARLRGLRPGGSLVLARGRTVRVAAVVDDTVVGGAEVAVARSRQRGAMGPARYLLVAFRGPRPALERAVRRTLGDVPARLRAPGETPFLRHGDAVLTQVAIKERFGEFSHRRATGRQIVQDPVWVSRHLRTAAVPLLGTVRCHRALLPALRGAMSELKARRLGFLVDRDGFAGCHNARLSTTGDSLSRHAWGVAVDLNHPANPFGATPAQDPRLVEVMERWGFAWGGRWLVPDAAHFEYRRPPDPQAGRIRSSSTG